MAKFPTVRTPTIEEVLDIAEGYGMTITVEDAESYRGLMEGTIASYHRLDDLDEPKLPVKYPRSPGYRPPPEENPYNAWYWKSEVKGRGGGPLKGKRVVLKDNICLAGVPMMNGATVLEGYVPDIDATVVTRILDAGGTIIGKAANTYLCFGWRQRHHRHRHGREPAQEGLHLRRLVRRQRRAGRHRRGRHGARRRPGRLDPHARMLVRHIRAQTHPWAGSLHRDLPIEQTLDHIGPMARSVSDVATLLQVIAGPDGHDPRQIGTKTQRYVNALDKGADGMKIGVVTEGFGHPESEDAVDSTVRAAVQRFTELGATVDEISIPMHLDGQHIWNGIAVEGATAMMLKGNGFGTNWEGYYATSLIDAYARGWRSRPDDLSETVKTVMMLGEYMHRNYHGRYYAKAQNLSRRLRETYDAVLAEYDVLAMPTLPMLATELPAPDCSREHYVDVALNMLANTCPFDASGHPAMTVPCGKADDSPIGMMLIGKRYDDATVIQAAAAFETLGVYQT